MDTSNVSRRKFVLLGGTAAAAAALTGIAGCSSGSGSASTSASASGSASAAASASASASASGSAAAKSVESDLASMTWDEILAEAKGQTVTFLAWGAGGADPYVQQWWEHLTEDMKAKYDITLNCVEQDSAETEKLSTDLSNKADATYDLFWGLGSSMAGLRTAGGLFGNKWLSKLDNYKYLNSSNNFVTFDGTAQINDEEAPFQGLNPSLVCSTDNWDPSLPYTDPKGIFHNFTELAEWVKLNPGKFTYMDLTGSGAFHGGSFCKAALAELTDDGNGGWKTVYDEGDSADVKFKKIDDNIEQWYKWGTSSEASQEAFNEKAGYLWAFLNEIAPNLMQQEGKAYYAPDAPTMREYVNSGDLACVFTTCTQVSNRVADAPANYPANPAIFMLDTTIGSWDYAIILSNATKKAGALVVANEMIDPEQQLFAFETTGNGYNVDYDLIGADMQKKFDTAIAGMGELTSSAEDIAQKLHTDKFGPVYAFLQAGWNTEVNLA